MRFACCTVALLASMLASGQTLPTFDLPGSLELVDLPAEATPVEAMMVSHPPNFLYFTRSPNDASLPSLRLSD